MKHHFITKTIRLACLLFLLLSGISLAEDGKTVKSAGTSPIYNNNIAKAREEAISYALAAAVNIKASEFLSGQDFARNFQKINEISYSRAKDFIETYKVIAESCAGKTCQVMMESGIAAEPLKQAISAFGKIETKPEPPNVAAVPIKKPDTPSEPLPDIRNEPLPDIKHEPLPDIQPVPKPPAEPIQPKALPKILLLMAEQNIENAYPQYWWRGSPQVSVLSEKIISERMTKKGFAIADHAGGIPDGSLRIFVIYQADIDNNDALKIGRMLQAEVVIAGKSMVYTVPGSPGEQSFSATTTARAIRTDTGEQIGSTLQTALTVNKDESKGSKDALEKSAHLASEELAAHISMAWQTPALSKPEIRPVTEWIELSVSGSSNIGNFIRFRKVLSEMPAVRELKVIESRGGEAKLGVSFEGGNAQSLADVIKQTDFQLFGVAIRQVAENRIRLELLPKP
ncbi:MAG: hypothetical protein BWK80_04220 [Desulfobacteraceae bacterium IS3]|nr:MAG: hypothetical protein BWK80_04220 [Desulfobacteraceae bacterium IS3]HAO23425.1 hypothetical protein [Desulfobacteraceae bacterium]